MLFEVKERVNEEKLSLEVINKIQNSIVNILKESYPNRSSDTVAVYTNSYVAVAAHEAERCIDRVIIDEDLFITKEDYLETLEEVSEDIFNQEQGYEELMHVAMDLAREKLRSQKVLVD